MTTADLFEIKSKDDLKNFLEIVQFYMIMRSNTSLIVSYNNDSLLLKVECPKDALVTLDCEENGYTFEMKLNRHYSEGYVRINNNIIYSTELLGEELIKLLNMSFTWEPLDYMKRGSDLVSIGEVRPKTVTKLWA